MGSLFRIVLLLVFVVVGFGIAITVASESGEVVVLTTWDEEGVSRETRLWIVDEGGVLWLRAGSPDAEWYGRLRSNADVVLERDGTSTPYRAEPMPGPERRDWINHRMAEKYGWADQVIGFIATRAEAVPIRLDDR